MARSVMNWDVVLTGVPALGSVRSFPTSYGERGRGGAPALDV